MSRKVWFRPKSLGVGAVPVSWEGWAMTIGMIIYVIGLALVFRPRAFPDGAPTELVPLLIWGGLTIGGLVVYMIIAWNRTSEPWFWRWEKSEKSR
ncbi:hypothetical protein JQU17_02445 [Ponticoccus sp. SC2-23]|uniref:hypothetical protein n=1 Tax=Alexandriicola marinus TaxID=2081710 RepID=UPI000FD8B35D|nr:hypothetical protein [Alexandriicola marinus]MBM1219042.1 hypothetical protein [Ponticoccus sp. SC6-9]MBM1223886.1 hypothetical protein [Ponticoccus sp. SC6-15]MBM1228856.1 hypothetical protein [Ponticoccus sp. SC6-38]MBM1232852.1 hypothetical protein [Ponticoccus sp. SC6-45]MBM1237198.1 hypothetical protein [Ponticoccus sp. SC6-49]MBM1241863.1 hypothetical protein [Ponticoccus sp. SC2-64]MBM1246376.1 hypothetical protein [Ponticoccus sp. SC6-42]MBM1250854.1 hypothetical protein [Pontico